MTPAGGLAAVGAVVPGDLTAPTFLAVVIVGVVVTALLYAERPPMTRRAVVALVPWMVVAATLSVLAAEVAYPPSVRPVVAGPGAYLTTYVVVAVAWFAVLQFARGARRAGGQPSYLGAMGVGVALVLLAALLVSAGRLEIARLFWLAVAPIAAAAVAAVVLVLLGLWYTEAAAYTGVVGGLVVFGHALGAIATAVAGLAGGPETLLSGAVRGLLAAVDAGALVGVDPQLLWIGGFVWAKLVLATAVVVALSTYTHRHPSRGNLLLGAFAALGIVGGVTSLLGFVVGG